MTPLALRAGLVCGWATALALGTSVMAADAGRAPAASSPARTSTTSRAARVLPDPALLDGTTQAADKKVEHGMIGEFELPGEEDVRNDRVGGRGGPQGQKQQAQMPTAGGGSPGGQTAMEGGGSGGSNEAGSSGGNASASAGAAAGAATNGTQLGAAGGTGTAVGMQVGSLSGEADSNPQGQISNKPQPVAIGDPAMQIKTVANAPGVVGAAAPAGATQQMESRIGGSGGGGGAKGDNANRGSEKGRSMPAGL